MTWQPPSPAPGGPPGGWQPPEGRPQRPPKSGWQIAGIVLAAIAAIGGVVILACVVMFYLAMSSWGSNK